MTPEARSHIEAAGKLLHLVADPVTEAWLLELNATTESLLRFYERDKDRRITYGEIVDEILRWVRRGLDVCVATYGHPGVFVHPSHEAIARARAEGYPARMLPGISAEDCLFADLGFNPGAQGCQSFEATYFLVCRPAFDPTALLVLWQIEALGRLDNDFSEIGPALRLLGSTLAAIYGPAHEVTLYAAALYPGTEPVVTRVPLSDLATVSIPSDATLVVPPLPRRTPDPVMIERLGLSDLAPMP